MRIVEERLRWFQAFTLLYEKAAPVLRQVANPDKLAAGELPLTPYTLAASNLTLRPILEAIRKLSEPKEQEFGDIQKHFKIALSSCIKLAEAAERYIELRERGIEDQVSLCTIISSTVLAHEYMESVSRKLEIIKPRVDNLEAGFRLESAPAEKKLKEKKATSEKVTKPAGAQLAVDKAADGIERGLDKLGDALVFPIEKLARYSGRFKTIDRKKGKRHHI